MNEWDSARASLVPVLRRVGAEGDSTDFLCRKAGANLVVWAARRIKTQSETAYLFDYVTDEIVADWRVSGEEVFEAAYDNFSAIDRGGQRIPEDSGDLVIFDRFGASSAAAVGCSGCLKWFQDLGDELVVGVPSRDRLFVTARQSRMASKVPQAVQHFYAKDEHPVSDQVYLWTRNSLTIWKEARNQ